jgi:hypothetical protein
MNRFLRALRDLFFFLTGVAVGVTGIVGSIYIYVLQEKANDRPFPYNRYSSRQREDDGRRTPED